MFDSLSVCESPFLSGQSKLLQPRQVLAHRAGKSGPLAAVSLRSLAAQDPALGREATSHLSSTLLPPGLFLSTAPRASGVGVGLGMGDMPETEASISENILQKMLIVSFLPHSSNYEQEEKLSS